MSADRVSLSLTCLLVLWALVPGIRRLIDWQLGFSALPIVSLIPLAMLFALALAVLGQTKKSPGGALRLVLVLWCAGFGYAMVVAMVAHNGLAAVYDLANFVLPMFVALAIVTTRDLDPAQLYARLSNVLLILGVLLSLYGVYQYVAPPPWDVLWMQNSEMVSIGMPEPFAVRVFSTLNSPWTLADFLVLTTLLALPRMLGSAWVALAVVLMMPALALTFARSAWLALVFGMLGFMLADPKKGMRLFFVLGVVLVVGGAIAFGVPTLLGNRDVTQSLVDRFQTFTDLQTDVSAVDRQEQSATALHDILSEPLGQGLGTVGTATKIGTASKTTVLDNGILARFLEMGFLGGLLYLAALCAAVVATLKQAIAGRNEPSGPLLAACASVQIALFGLDLSTDHHLAFGGVFFWIVVGIAFSLEKKQGQEVSRAGAALSGS